MPDRFVPYWRFITWLIVMHLSMSFIIIAGRATWQSAFQESHHGQRAGCLQ